MMVGTTVAVLSIGLVISAGVPDEPECAPAVTALFSSIEGSWSVEASRRVEPGVFDQMPGEARFEVAMGGCALVETLRLRAAATDRTSVSTMAASADGLQLAVVDSDHGTFTVSDGLAESDRLVFGWSRDLGSRVMSTRAEYVVVSPERLEVRRWLQRSAGAEWELTFSAVYTRATRPVITTGRVLETPALLTRAG